MQLAFIPNFRWANRVLKKPTPTVSGCSTLQSAEYILEIAWQCISPIEIDRQPSKAPLHPQTPVTAGEQSEYAPRLAF